MSCARPVLNRLVVAFLLSSVSPSALSAPAKPAAAAKAPKLDVTGLKKALETGDEPAVLAALETLEAAGSAQAPVAAPLVAQLLARGGSARVLERALEVSATLAQQSATHAVLPYVRHRSAALRGAAAKALGATGGPEAVAALRTALHDKEPRVRSLAAESIGALRAAAAVPDLFLILSKPAATCDCAQGDDECKSLCAMTAGSNPEAAAAIGLLCTPADCQKLVDLTGKLPFEIIERGIEPMLLRPDTELSEGFKLDTIDRIRRLQTKGARVFLETVRARFPEQGNAHVRLGLDAAIAGKPVPKPKP